LTKNTTKLIVICTQGQPLTLKPEIKQVIVVLKDYFDRNKSTFVVREASTKIRYWFSHRRSSDGEKSKTDSGAGGCLYRS